MSHQPEACPAQVGGDTRGPDVAPDLVPGALVPQVPGNAVYRQAQVLQSDSHFGQGRRTRVGQPVAGAEPLMVHAGPRLQAEQQHRSAGVPEHGQHLGRGHVCGHKNHNQIGVLPPDAFRRRGAFNRI